MVGHTRFLNVRLTDFQVLVSGRARALGCTAAGQAYLPLPITSFIDDDCQARAVVT
jgi:hypothetical protein